MLQQQLVKGMMGLDDAHHNAAAVQAVGAWVDEPRESASAEGVE